MRTKTRYGVQVDPEPGEILAINGPGIVLGSHAAGAAPVGVMDPTGLPMIQVPGTVEAEALRDTGEKHA